MRRRLVQSLAHATGIVAVGVVLGLLANGASNAGLPLFETSAAPALGIGLADARRAHADGRATFIDARPHDLFFDGHIAGAVNVPLAERSGRLDELRRELPRSRPVIVYCDGGSCESATRLGAWLVSHGWRDVNVLGDGYPAWVAAGFPVARGEQP